MMTIALTVAAMIMVFITTVVLSGAQYNESIYTKWALFLWLGTATAALWYFTFISAGAL